MTELGVLNDYQLPEIRLCTVYNEIPALLTLLKEQFFTKITEAV